MRTSILLDELRAASLAAAPASTKAAVLDRLRDCLDALNGLETDALTPSRTREKIGRFLDLIDESRTELGARFFQPAFALNAVGKAMALADLIAEPVVAFVQVGLYFFGLDQIEQRWSARAAIYSGVHADFLGEFLGRDSLKELVQFARERIAKRGRFCLTWHYLNGLRKAYWSHCRHSEDALDVAVSAEASVDRAFEPVQPAEAISPESSDRVAMVLAIFERDLTARQRWIYLAKNRALLAPRDQDGFDTQVAMSVEDLLSGFDTVKEHEDLGWVEISDRLGINEKTAKREYLRSLHVLLQQSAEAVFGLDRIPNGFVRRVLESIRTIVHEKDLRFRDNTGRGLGTLVEKWEVALRFVLNHQRISA